MQDKKLIWYDARSLDPDNKIFSLLFTLNFEYLIVSLNTFLELKSPKKIKYIIEIKKEEDINKLTEGVFVLSDDQKLLNKASKKGFKTVFNHEVKDQETMNQGWKIGIKFDFLLVSFKSETNIPLELLIAKLQTENTVILKQVKDFEDAEVSFGVMEQGCHGVVLNSEKSEDILDFDNYMKQNKIGTVKLVNAKVTGVEHIGMGHRACIDTTTMLGKDEGMIIGSISGGGLLVSSETHYLPYMELRPFRVNAGAIHSYIWSTDGMTRYISELKSGDKVLAVDTSGKSREVTIGRVKTELRPLLKIEVETENGLLNVIVQDDWHIRIFGGDGEPRNASTVKIGDDMLVYTCEGGRHVGIKIDENFCEK